LIIIILTIIIFFGLLVFSALNDYYNDLEAERITTHVFESYDINNDDKLDFNALQIFLTGIEKQEDNPEILNDNVQGSNMAWLVLKFYDRKDKNLNKTEFKLYAMDHLVNKGYRV